MMAQSGSQFQIQMTDCQSDQMPLMWFNYGHTNHTVTGALAVMFKQAP